MASDSNKAILNVENPYLPRSTYKDALMATVTDSTNRMGVNTFKLINIIQKSKKHQDSDRIEKTNTADDNSGNSENTTAQTNTSELKFYRMRFQFTIEETSADTYLEDVADHINKILEVINLNTPGVSLAPWHQDSEGQKEDIITTLSDDALTAVKYLYGFKAGLNRAGTQYLRVRLAFPSRYSADDIVKKIRTPL
jgi:hypothetical protein